MSPQEDIQENPAAHRIDNLGVGRPLSEVKQLDRASTLTLKLGPLVLGFDVIGARRTFDGRIYLARAVSSSSSSSSSSPSVHAGLPW